MEEKYTTEENFDAEERYNAINQLIHKIASYNPHITQEQITRAKAMYNGDPRPLEVIEGELLAYSKEIRAYAERRAFYQAQDAKNKANGPRKPANIEEPEEEVLPRFRPGFEDDLVGSLQLETEEESELTNMLREYDIDVNGQNTATNTLAQNESTQISYERPKQFVKTMPTNNNNNNNNNSGQSASAPAHQATAGYTGTATLCALFSVMALIMSVAVIVAK